MVILILLIFVVDAIIVIIGVSGGVDGAEEIGPGATFPSTIAASLTPEKTLPSHTNIIIVIIVIIVIFVINTFIIYKGSTIIKISLFIWALPK